MNIAFKFSRYFLPIFVKKLLPNLDFTLPIFFRLIPITLEGCGASQITLQQPFSLSTLYSFQLP